MKPTAEDVPEQGQTTSTGQSCNYTSMGSKCAGEKTTIAEHLSAHDPASEAALDDGGSKGTEANVHNGSIDLLPGDLLIVDESTVVVRPRLELRDTTPYTILSSTRLIDWRVYKQSMQP